MKHAQFDYVNQFHCLAGDCPDTCCKDWQIILDEDALARYRAMPGPLGEQVRAALVTENGETRFREEGGRCVLLRDDGLCPIQAAYGAEALCRTCYTHPRFTEEYGQTAELTLSLSCPEAARLLLTHEAPLRIETQDAGTYRLALDMLCYAAFCTLDSLVVSRTPLNVEMFARNMRALFVTMRQAS